MADSNAERQRRKRLHASGDHSQCDPRRCAAGRAPLNGHGAESDPVSVSANLAAFVAALNLAPADPKAAMAAVALKLAARFDESPSERLAHEVVSIIRSLMEFPGQPGDGLDLLRAKRYARRAERLMGEAL
jgi:hypothetical protein